MAGEDSLRELAWLLIVTTCVVQFGQFRYGWPYEDIHRAVVHVLRTRGVATAETLLAEYPEPNAKEIRELAYELPWATGRSEDDSGSG